MSTEDMRNTINLLESIFAENAPPGKKAEHWIKANKKNFKERYGTRWEQVLYATAWKKFGHHVNEEYEYQESETIIIKSNCSEKICKLLEWIKNKADIGTGITITAIDNGNEKIQIYIDGDGSDKIESIECKEYESSTEIS